MADTAKWYVVHTYSGYENKVAQNIEKVVENHQLQDLITGVKIPTETVIEVKKNKKREAVERKIFPGYVLVKMIMTDDSWYVVRNIRGVTGFVGPASKPIPLTEEEISALGIETSQASVSESTAKTETQQVVVGYGPGDSVKVIAGPLEGFLGTVDEIDTANNKVKLTVSMFGRETPVELELEQVVAADE